MKRWYVIDTESGEVTTYSQTVLAHSRASLVQLVESQGFKALEQPAGWPVVNESQPDEFYPLVAVAD